MEKNAKIYIAGHDGMVGSAIYRRLKDDGYEKFVTRELDELDLTNQAMVEDFFKTEKPDYVFLAAAKVGGILANSEHKAEFFYDNMQIAANVIHFACKYKAKKLLNLGSSCIYPKLAPQPLKEEYLLTGPLEDTNDAYALAKIGAIKMCKYYNEQYGTDFISVMPTNLYGENDNFNLASSHVLPAMIRKFHDAKTGGNEVTLWGDGSPFREFLNVNDLADCVVYLMNNKSFSDIGDFVNIGTGKDIAIKELASMIAQIVGFNGKITWDTSKPNGTPRKLLNVSAIHAIGWNHKIDLPDGIKRTYKWFLENIDNIRK